MPKIHVSRNVNINASPDEVYKILSDFNHWRAWSPWLIQEPEATNKVSDDGKLNEWEGERVGSGNMRITDEKANEQIKMDLTFLKPWKSEAKVTFELSEKDHSTDVTWSMDSSLPFFMFWMKKMMTELIGMDYDRGLKMLKELIEEGQVHSNLEFVGNGSYPGCSYIGLTSEVTMNQMADQMSSDFEKLGAFSNDHKDQVFGEPFSIYHKWGIVNKKVKYTAGVPVKSIPSDLPKGFVIGEIPATKTYTLRHIGRYHHLGNAWSTLQGLKRAKVFRMKNRIHPFEAYVTNPAETNDNDQIVDIHFAIK